MKFDLIIFDLDGTLIDSHYAVINAFKFALGKFNKEIPDDSILNSFNGAPLHETFSSHFGLENQDNNLAIQFFRSYMGEHGIKESILYPNVEDVLKTIFENDVKITIATNKLEKQAKELFSFYKLDKYVEKIFGSVPDIKMDKNRTVASIVSHYGNIPNDRILMVGDRKYDIIAAKMSNIKSCGILNHSDNKNEFIENEADYIIENPADLLDIIKEN